MAVGTAAGRMLVSGCDWKKACERLRLEEYGKTCRNRNKYRNSTTFAMIYRRIDHSKRV